jgi:hypothetical protein
LFSDSLSDLVTSEGLTGLTFRKATVRTTSGQPLAQNFQEAIVTGWGGMARAESGIKLEEKCPSCGFLHYSNLTNPQLLLQHGEWDGSDFFIVWPMPRLPLVTSRVKHLFRQHRIGPCRFLSLSSLKTDKSGFSPGRLSYWMPTERAAALGNSLGID